MTRISYIPNRVLDSDGIADGAALYVYQSGTTTPVNLYADPAFASPVTNPYYVPAGAAVPNIYTDFIGELRFRVMATSEVAMDEDPYMWYTTQTDLNNLRDEIKAATVDNGDGAGTIIWGPGVAGVFNWVAGDMSSKVTLDPRGGVYRPSQLDPSGTTGCWVRQVDNYISAAWFGTPKNGVDDDLPALGAATAVCRAEGRALFIPAGLYRISDAWTVDQVSLIGEQVASAVSTRIICSGTAGLRLTGARKEYRNIELWFNRPISPNSIGFRFGNGATQFARNVVQNLSVRYAGTAFYAASDMWGNTFTQMNADFCSVYGYNFTASPSGTTNSFRNIYALGASQRGTIGAGTTNLYMADPNLWAVGSNIVVMGVGADRKALVTSVASIGLDFITINDSTTFAGTDVHVFSACTGWYSSQFSDTHFVNLYVDACVSNANGHSGAVVFNDTVVHATSVRFEACAIIGPNALLCVQNAHQGKVDTVAAFSTLISAGEGTTGALTLNRLACRDMIWGTIGTYGFIHYSGGFQHWRNASAGAPFQVKFLGSVTTSALLQDAGWTNCWTLYRNSERRSMGVTPVDGIWDVGDRYYKLDPTVGASGGVCTQAGVLRVGAPTGTTATGVTGSNFVTLNTFAGLNRGDIVSFGGSGRYTIVDARTQPDHAIMIYPALAADITDAPVALATPVFKQTPVLV